MRRIKLFGLLVVGLILLAGCRLEVTTGVEVSADGTGSVSLVFGLDRTLLAELDSLEVDPTVEVQALAPRLDAWQLDRSADDDGGLALTLTRDIDDATRFGDVLRELSAGLSSHDPALVTDIELAVDGEGAASINGEVAFRPPSSSGAAIDGEPVGPADEELARLAESVVEPSLVVTLPGKIERHDADQLQGRTLTWQIPVGDTRPITAVAQEPGFLDRLDWRVVAGAVGGVVVLAVIVALARRRSRSARATTSET